MPIVNRNLDVSLQRVVYQQEYTGANLVNGASGTLVFVPYPCNLDAAAIALYGISGSPQFQLSVNRWNGTSGVAGTFIVAVGSSNTPNAYGVSGGFTMIIPAIGSTLTQLQTNDVLLYAQTGGTSAGAGNAIISIVLRPLQDNKTHHGIL
jgi:hypothetical protein